MFRKRRSLGLALLAFGIALSLCTLAEQGWAQHEIATELGNAGGALNWVCNGGATAISSDAFGYDANWNFVNGCEVQDAEGSTQTTTCSTNAVNVEVRLDEIYISEPQSITTIRAMVGTWANGAVAGATISACQAAFGNCGGSCRNVPFTAEAAGYN